MTDTLPSSWTVVESKSRPDTVYYYNVKSRATRWEKPVDTAAPAKVRARHLLVKHNAVRNPISRPKGSVPVTLTREEATDKINGFLDQIRADVGLFETLAGTESDCTSGKRGGDLGEFGPQQMTFEFEEAAFELAVGELSGVIESPSGFHIIQRTA